jgi:hypothetical protein
VSYKHDDFNNTPSVLNHVSHVPSCVVLALVPRESSNSGVDQRSDVSIEELAVARAVLSVCRHVALGQNLVHVRIVHL